MTIPAIAPGETFVLEALVLASTLEVLGSALEVLGSALEVLGLPRAHGSVALPGIDTSFSVPVKSAGHILNRFLV